MNFAIFGLYAYWQQTGDPKSERLLRGAIQTIRDRVADYRVVGGISHYCFRILMSGTSNITTSMKNNS